MHPDWIVPPALPAGIGAVFTTRAGGVSTPPWDGLNLGDHVGDAPASVALNRQRLARAIGARPVFLSQVHGCEVVRLDGTSLDAAAMTPPMTPPMTADACWTTVLGVACCILVADCLPVLLAAPGGQGVAAAHAGWRGLAGGVIEAAARALADGVGCRVDELTAWLGPCIAQDDFEVGPDVLAAFGLTPSAQAAAATPAARCFAPGRPDRPGRWQADLAGLAALRLAALGVTLAAGPTCRTDDPRLYSYRRQGVTGRFAGCIWRL